MSSKKTSNYIFKTFLSVGVHIGHPIYDRKNKMIFNYLTIGTRDSIHIIDMKRTSFFLRRAIQFLYTMNTNINFNFFFYSFFSDLDSSLKPILGHMICRKNVLNVCMNFRWTSGLVTNYRYCFLRFLNRFCYDFLRISRGAKKRRKKRTTYRSYFSNSTTSINMYNSTVFKFLLFRVMYIFISKITDNLLWKKYSSSTKVLLKVIVFFKTYKYLFRKPDIICAINPSNATGPTLDFKNSKIPIIGVVDSTSDIAHVTYPIPSNDDSIVLAFFFFKIFVNTIVVANSVLYNSAFKNRMK